MNNKKTTKIKKLYYGRFFLRIVMFLCAIFIYMFYPSTVDVMLDFNMFTKFNILHIFFVLWIGDIVMQLMPMTGQFSMGSLKHFKCYMKKVKIKDELRQVKLMLAKQIKANLFICVCYKNLKH